MDQAQRKSVLERLRLVADLPDHALQVEGMPYVSGAVRRQRVTYAVPGGVRLRAWLLRPATGQGPWPGLIALHPHGDAFDQGGDEIAGVIGRREHHYGAFLASKGFCVICPDLPCFGQQEAPKGMPSGHRWEEHQFSRALIEGRSLLAITLDQLRCAVSALLDYDKTAEVTVSVVGFGMGARTAAWLAFADKRVGAVWMHAGLGQQQMLLEHGRLLPRHNILPGMQELGLDQADIVADILPRALGISYGLKDRVAIPEAVQPVLAMVRERAKLFPKVKIAVIEGAYDHRFPAEVQQQIADQLLAWIG